MALVEVEGVAVPAALASSFADPKKRPFSYTKPLPPSVDLPRSTTYTSRQYSKVLPILSPTEFQTIMPSNIQYNTPMPIYSRESAEEQYKQQLGIGPEQPLGVSDKHFDPSKSETLRAIKEGENDTFGKHFYEQIALAEAPRVLPIQEPSWTTEARRRSERAHSATPSGTHVSPIASSYYAPNYQTLQHTKQSYGHHTAPTKGYEFGGLDYVDKSRIPSDSYYYYDPQKTTREERRFTPGYEMGGTDFTKREILLTKDPYHGHGPERPKLHPRYLDLPVKRNEMNIESAPNVNKVSADILVGDTVSNQKLLKETEYVHDSFGTSFGPTTGFKKEHRTVQRRMDAPHPTVFSLSAKKDGRGYTSYAYDRSYRPQMARRASPPTPPTQSYIYKGRSHSEVPMERYASSEGGVKEIYTHEPTWSETVRQRKNAWEMKARNTEERLQLPPSSKIPAQQPPYWYNRANKTHNIWQDAAERQYQDDQQEVTDRRYYDTSYEKSNRQYHDNRQEVTDRRHYDTRSEKSDRQYQDARQEATDRRHYDTRSEKSDRQYYDPKHEAADRYTHDTQRSDYRIYDEERSVREQQGDYGSFTSQTQFIQSYDNPQYGRELIRESSPPHRDTNISSVQRTSYTTQHGVPVTKDTYKTYTAVPVLAPPPAPFSSNVHQLSSSQESAPQIAKDYHGQTFYEKKLHESSSERVVNQPPPERMASQPLSSSSYSVERSSYISHPEQRQQSNLPIRSTTSTVVSQGAGSYIDAKAEMAEVLPRGTIANTEASAQGKYLDGEGKKVDYRRDFSSSVNPHSESSLLKEEERRVTEKPLEPGVISRHITTKYYKKKTVTDTTTTTTE